MHKNNLRKKNTHGFTLIEVMVVVVILAILAAIIVPRILSRPEQARKTAAKQDILSIQNALSLYKLDNGFYPSTSQGLQALVSKPTGAPVPGNWAAGGYLKKVPVDPFKQQPYQYAHPGTHGTVDVWCEAPKDVGGEIGNWQSNE